MSEPIYTYEDGRPIPGHPGEPPPLDADIETKIAWMRARNDYQDRVTDVANRAFADQFAKTMRKTQVELDREEVERRGYPPGLDYEALILAEDEEM